MTKAPEAMPTFTTGKRRAGGPQLALKKSRHGNHHLDWSRQVGPGQPCFVIAEGGINPTAMGNSPPSSCMRLASRCGRDQVSNPLPEHEMLRGGRRRRRGESLFDLLTRLR